MHSYRQFIQRYCSITNTEWIKVEGCLTRREITKGELLLREGEVCQQVYFLESGLLHYYINSDGTNLTKFFTVAPYCFTSQRSFNQRIPATENIAAIENAVVWQMSAEDAFRLRKSGGFGDFVAKLTQEVQFFTEQIIEELQTMTAEERYWKMMAEGDPLLSRVPQKILASYLGIAPQSLSRIRKKRSQKSRN